MKRKSADAKSKERQRQEEERRHQEKERQRQERKRQREMRRQLLESSGVRKELDAVNNEFLSVLHRSKQGKLLIDDDCSTVRLAWGKVVTTQENGSWYFKEGTNCRYIEVKVDPDHRTVTVNGQTIAEAEWLEDRSVIDDAMAKAYIEPQQLTPPPPEPRASRHETSRDDYDPGDDGGCHFE